MCSWVKFVIRNNETFLQGLETFLMIRLAKGGVIMSLKAGIYLLRVWLILIKKWVLTFLIYLYKSRDLFRYLLSSYFWFYKFSLKTHEVHGNFHLFIDFFLCFDYLECSRCFHGNSAIIFFVKTMIFYYKMFG